MAKEKSKLNNHHDRALSERIATARNIPVAVVDRAILEPDAEKTAQMLDRAQELIESEATALDGNMAELIDEFRAELKDRKPGQFPKTDAAIKAIDAVFGPKPTPLQQIEAGLKTIIEADLKAVTDDYMDISIKEPGKTSRPATPDEEEQIIRGWSLDDKPTALPVLEPESSSLQRTLTSTKRHRLPTKRERREQLQRLLEQTIEEIADLSMCQLRRPWSVKATDLSTEIEHLAESLRHETDHHADTANLRDEADRTATHFKALAREIGGELQDTLLNSGLIKEGNRDRRLVLLIPRLPRRLYPFEQEEKDELAQLGTMDDIFLTIFNVLGDDESRVGLEEMVHHDVMEMIEDNVGGLEQLQDEVYSRDDVKFDEEGQPIIDDDYRMKAHSDWDKVMIATQRKVLQGVEFLYPMLERIRRRGRFRGCRRIEPFGDDLRVTLTYTPY